MYTEISGFKKPILSSIKLLATLTCSYVRGSMNTTSLPSTYKNCISRDWISSSSTDSMDLNVNSCVEALFTLFMRTRVNAEPLPGLTNSVFVTKNGWSLNKIYIPFLMLPPLTVDIGGYYTRNTSLTIYSFLLLHNVSDFGCFYLKGMEHTQERQS